MSTLAQVQFADGLILFAEFDRTDGYYCTRLHGERHGVYRHWQSNNHHDCLCGKDEPVLLATLADGGHAIEGRACRHCLAITYDPLATAGAIHPMLSVGPPDWWAGRWLDGS